ncbi:MAG: zinc ribbon domain-containing protein, partial [Bacteroidales bacterium]|nr:zinc ribbon domain-containing protein [Bacteroidales bacterium]
MKCSNCNAEIADNAKFCPKCGSKVEKVEPVKNCPNCGTAIVVDSKFCSKCGTKIEMTNKCPNCGETIKEGSKFCHVCGTKIVVGNGVNEKANRKKCKYSNGFISFEYPDNYVMSDDVEYEGMIISSCEIKGDDISFISIEYYRNINAKLLNDQDLKSKLTEENNGQTTVDFYKNLKFSEMMKKTIGNFIGYSTNFTYVANEMPPRLVQ